MILQTVVSSENIVLDALSNLEEVKETLFILDAHNALALDGFYGKFFTFCCDVVAADVLGVRDFRACCPLTKSISNFMIILITKVLNPSSFSNF